MFINPVSLYPVQKCNKVTAHKCIASNNINFQKANYIKAFEAEYNMIPKCWDDVYRSFERLIQAAKNIDGVKQNSFFTKTFIKHDLKYNLLQLTWNKNVNVGKDYLAAMNNADEKKYAILSKGKEPVLFLYNYGDYNEDNFIKKIANGYRFDVRIIFNDLSPNSKKTISFGVDYNSSDLFMHKGDFGPLSCKKGYAFYDPADHGVSGIKEELTYNPEHNRIYSKYYDTDGTVKY